MTKQSSKGTSRSFLRGNYLALPTACLYYSRHPDLNDKQLYSAHVTTSISVARPPSVYSFLLISQQTSVFGRFWCCSRIDIQAVFRCVSVGLTGRTRLPGCYFAWFFLGIRPQSRTTERLRGGSHHLWHAAIRLFYIHTQIFLVRQSIEIRLLRPILQERVVPFGWVAKKHFG